MFLVPQNNVAHLIGLLLHMRTCTHIPDNLRNVLYLQSLTSLPSALEQDIEPQTCCKGSDTLLKKCIWFESKKSNVKNTNLSLHFPDSGSILSATVF